MITPILDLFYPPRCAFCGKLLETAGDVCPACEETLPLREEGQILRKVGKNNYPCAVAM
ncbi:MAG: double zinc ribbon domain-containing protein, partial [Oscillospiraceae bacterium]|nr:double zinc ribbon domain-containing protein [Oscillospiraceae bacterium]